MFNKFIKLIIIVTLLMGSVIANATDYEYEYKSDMDIYTMVNNLNYGDRLIIKGYHRFIRYVVYDKHLNGIYLYTEVSYGGAGGSVQFIPYKDWYIGK